MVPDSSDQLLTWLFLEFLEKVGQGGIDCPFLLDLLGYVGRDVAFRSNVLEDCLVDWIFLGFEAVDHLIHLLFSDPRVHWRRRTFLLHFLLYF